MAATESKPKGLGPDKKEAPATIVTLESKGKQKREDNDDAGSKKSDSSEKRDEISFRQARTPKHNNKSTPLTDKEKQDGVAKPRELQYPPRHPGAYLTNSFTAREQPQHQQYPPPHYDGGSRPHPTGRGADFSPRERQFYSSRSRAMPTVSPGGADAQYRNHYPTDASSRSAGDSEFAARTGAIYGQAPPSYDSFRPPPQGDYRAFSNQQHFGYNSGPSYPPTGPYNRAYPPRDEFRGGNPAAYQPPPYLPREYQQRLTPHDAHYPEQAGAVTRAVSSSFDRSIKSREEAANHSKAFMEIRTHYPPQSQEASVGGASEDSSWHKLNQVASIDDAAIQERLLNKNTPRHAKEPTSTSSSLTNSPNDDNKLPLPTPSKLAALDSLSSVASGQEPIDTKVGPPSPGSSTASLDLMKCHSGSSGLLHGFPVALHSRDMSSGSLQIPAEYRLDNKRSRENRGDSNTSLSKEVDLRRAPSGDGTIPHITKKQKKGKKSPLGIDCSPPCSPAREQSRDTGRGRSIEQGNSFNSSPSQNYFDKPPIHTYSMESMGRGGYPLMRPGSSTSSTATPHEGPRDTIGPTLPSWDIQAQDSFGNTSIGVGPVMSNFSFSNDYPMLSGSGSNLERPSGIPPSSDIIHHQRSGPPPPLRHPTVETRNPSFDSGNYHGSFNRTDTMDSGGGYHRHMPPPPGYHEQNHFKPPGPYPPHPPSWGPTQPHHGPQYPVPPPHAHYNQFNPRTAPPPTQRSPHRGPFMGSRNFSEDSGARTSPPVPHMLGRHSFVPPPEFSAPHNPHLVRRPPPAVYIMSSTGGGGPPTEPHAPGHARPGTGIYSWTKEDDRRLTEVMTKYKNARDWEPIAKEHGRGKSAKECHERWIRYLKPGVRKGQWQDHEDAIVVEAVSTSSEQPFTRWSDLAQRLPGRVGKQIRDRWVNHLNPAINHLPFSKEDDLLLWNGHMKHGKRWVEISSKFFVNSRSENHIKNRWYSASFKKFISNEFGPDAYTGGKTQKKEKDLTGKDSMDADADAETDVSVESI